MLIEASQVKSLPVVDSDQLKLGLVDSLYFEGDKGSVIGIKVQKDGIIKKFASLDYRDGDLASQQVITITDPTLLSENLKAFDEAVKKYGKVIGVRATTETGRSLGKIEDVIFEIETGLIARFVLRNYLLERIIPRQFLVSIAPRQIVFQDVVTAPTFDKIATGELSAAPKI